MMTQTLRMDIEDSVNEADKGIFGLTALPEFKLNGKYRDTLALHGKSGEEAQGLPLRLDAFNHLYRSNCLIGV